MREYRTEEYRLYPDKAQKNAICKKFDIADDAFDAIAAIVNAMAGESDKKEMQATVDGCIINVPLDWVEARGVKNAVKKLIPKLVTGEISAILPRNRYRSVRTLDVMATLIPSETVMINGVGTVQLAFHRPLPDNARVFRVMLKSDCCGERFYILYSYYYEFAGVAPHPIDPDQVIGIFRSRMISSSSAATGRCWIPTISSIIFSGSSGSSAWNR